MRQVPTRDTNGVSFVTITSQATLVSLESVFLERVVTTWEGLLFFCAIEILPVQITSGIASPSWQKVRVLNLDLALGHQQETSPHVIYIVLP